MERPRLHIFALALLYIATPAAAELDPSWQWVAGHDGIEVYSRDVVGSPLDESLAITRLDTTLTAVVALILDVDNNHHWIDSVDQSRILERTSKYESINYTVSNAPWPVSDRDAVVRTRVTQDSESLQVLISSEALPDFIPQQQGLIRVRTVTSSWQLLPLEDGGVAVRYQVHSDPGGKLPNWLINAVVTDQPWKTLFNMRRAVTHENYINARIPFIEDPANYHR
jgi:hypothetical protein